MNDYRDKAAQARRLARAIPGDPAAKMLLEMADHFEALAVEAERGFAGEKSIEPTQQQPQAQQQQQQPQTDDDADTQ